MIPVKEHKLVTQITAHLEKLSSKAQTKQSARLLKEARAEILRLRYRLSCQ